MTMTEDIAAIIVRKAKEGIPFHRYSWEPAQSYPAPSVEEIARAIFIEAVEPALVLVRQGLDAEILALKAEVNEIDQSLHWERGTGPWAAPYPEAR